MRHRMVNTVALLAAAIVTGCSSNQPFALSSPNTVSLLITNTNSSDSIDVIGFPSLHMYTPGPGGMWHFGLARVGARNWCVLLPTSSEIRVSGPDAYGVVRTDTTRWTPANAMSLGAYAAGTNALSVAPTTTEFIPIAAVGWAVTFPDGAITPHAPCTPQASTREGASP